MRPRLRIAAFLLLLNFPAFAQDVEFLVGQVVTKGPEGLLINADAKFTFTAGEPFRLENGTVSFDVATRTWSLPKVIHTIFLRGHPRLEALVDEDPVTALVHRTGSYTFTDFRGQKHQVAAYEFLPPAAER